MDFLFICFSVFIIGIIIGVIVEHYFFKKDNGTPDLNSIILKLNNIMALIDDLKAKVIDLNAKADTLQASVDAEQATIEGLLATNAQVVTDLNAEVQRLNDIIAAGGTVTDADIQSVIDGVTTASDKLATTQADIEGTVA